MALENHGDLRWKAGAFEANQSIPGIDEYRYLVVRKRIGGNYEVHPFQTVADAAQDLVQKDDLSFTTPMQLLDYWVSSVGFDVPVRVNFVGYDASLRHLTLKEKSGFLTSLYTSAKGRMRTVTDSSALLTH